jgi:pimeloyl-ACP methyl ester carboxylesterase
MKWHSQRFTRRQILQTASLLLAASANATNTGEKDRSRSEKVNDQILALPRNENVEYGHDTLPLGIRSRYIDNNNGLRMHFLEAGFEDRARPCVVLLHGFPELAYTWRNQLLPLAQAGFHAVAPDLRGYGRSVKAPVKFDDNILPYRLLNRLSDVLGFVRAIGYERVAAVVGHDWSSLTAAWCALVRPDVFRSVVLMSTPFDGTIEYPVETVEYSRKSEADTDISSGADIQTQLAALRHPRKHYRWYSASRGANDDMWHAPQGVHDLLRALYYFKSADWKGNKPHPLKSWTATELAKMPTYYIMDLDKGIAETMAEEMPSKAEIAACKWMTEKDIEVYSSEYIRTGFQGGLNLYRIFEVAGDLSVYSGRTIDVPAVYIAGAREWGVYQTPGAFEAMQHGACTRLLGVHLVDGAGHSLAEEQPQRVNQLLTEFLVQAKA